MKYLPGSFFQRGIAVLCCGLLSLSVGSAQAPAGYPPASYGTQPAPPAGASPQGAERLSPEMLDNLVAPVALYPDPLLGQVLAASTYPLEVVEAAQWAQQNSNLRGPQLMDAAKQQPWDASVQALVAFPDALKLLSSDVRWTTDLGNAFLANQPDVMNAIQAMRARAQANGRLATTQQQVVTTNTQEDQSAIAIQPADPQVIYVPQYNPAYVWGPPAYGAYPPLWYPSGLGYGFGFGPGVFLSALFPGLLGLGGWGWGLGWLGSVLGGLFINGGFFNHFGFHGGFGYGGGFGGGYGFGRSAWVHDAGHRMGVPYPNRALASRFGAGDRFRGGVGGGGERYRGATGNFASSNRASGNRASASAGGGGWTRFGENRSGENRSGENRGTSFRGAPGAANSLRSGSSYGGGSYSAGNYRGSFGGGAAQGYRSPGSAAGTANSFAGSRGGASSFNRSFAPSAGSAPRAQNFSAPRAQNFSAPRSSGASRSFSAPRSSGGGSSHFSGHSSGGHSSGGGHGGGGGHSGGGHKR